MMKCKLTPTNPKLWITSLNSLYWNLIWYKILEDFKAIMIGIKEELISSVEVFR
jgi:hypothetical protein